MRAICVWCNKELGERPGPKDEITHGMCQSCSDNMKSQVRARATITRQDYQDYSDNYLRGLGILGMQDGEDIVLTQWRRK